MENSMFSKLMDKKKKEGNMLSDVHKEARQSILDDLMDNMGSADAEPLKGLKKVSVSSDSKHGLAQGLDKAKEMLHGQSDDESDEDPKEELAESPMDEQSEHEDMGPAGEHDEMPSKEEILAQIEQLHSKLSQMKE